MKLIEIKTEEQLQAAFAIRMAVFVKEQGVAADNELDGYDTLTAAQHFLLIDGDLPIGTARLRFIANDTAKLERICVLANHRKGGNGRLIIEGLEQHARAHQQVSAILHGQTQAEGFYNKLGYQTVSDIFYEEAIPHVEMSKTL